MALLAQLAVIRVKAAILTENANVVSKDLARLQKRKSVSDKETVQAIVDVYNVIHDVVEIVKSIYEALGHLDKEAQQQAARGHQ